MRISTLAIAAFVLFIVSVPLYAGQTVIEQDSKVQEQFINLPTREGVTVPTWVISPRLAQASVVLFSGGGGRLNISQEGVEINGNFLIRSRELFAAHELVVMIPDTPSDQGDLYGFRTAEEHATDIKTMITWLRKFNPGKPVWLVGTSRGVISAAGAAAKLSSEQGPNGIILSASVTRPSNSGADSLQDIELTNINVPTLLVHHEQDECYVTPFEDIPELLNELTHVQSKEIKSYRDGKNNGNECGAKSYHGFSGLEKEVVKDMTAWMLKFKSR